MAIKRASTSTALNGFPKYPSMWDQSTNAATFDCIGTITVPSGTSYSAITFAGIPQTYTHLQLRITANCTSGSSGQTGGYLRYNGDATGGTAYPSRIMYGTGAAASVGFNTSGNVGFQAVDQGTASTTIFAANIVDIFDYTLSTKYKTSRCLGGFDANGTGQIWQTAQAGTTNANPITSLTLTLQDGNFYQYSRVSLYGVK